jgi:HD-GYP domain-containing protein (c-di-GMP phosphodiesterase class II)
MLLAKDTPTGDLPPRLKQLRSLAIILHEEFGVPFHFYDAATGRRLEGVGTDEHDTAALAFSQSAAPVLEKSSAARLVADGIAEVQLVQVGYYRLALPFADVGQPATVAVGVIAGLARTPAEVIQERARLGKWLQSVHLRLSVASQAAQQKRQRPASNNDLSSLAGLEALISLEDLLRTQRIEKTTANCRSQVLEAATKVLRAQTILWVPAQGAEALIEGEPLLSPWDCGQLARLLAQDPEGARTGFLRVNQVQASSWGKRFPRLVTMLAVPVPPRSAASWLIALNKTTCPAPPAPGSSRSAAESAGAGEPHFRRTDAALLLPFAALLGAGLRASRQHQQSKELMVGLTRALAAAVDVRDAFTAGHSERVARIAVELARQVGIADDELSDVYLSGLLHDVGKIGVSDSILRKREPLTAGEYSHLREHVTIGSRMMAELHPIAHLLPAVLHHHERYDGTGSPDGLKGDSIPLVARILAVAESYDAMTTSGPGSIETARERAVAILSQGAGFQWDARVIGAFFDCYDRIRAIHERSLIETANAARQEVSPAGPRDAMALP